MLRTAAEISRDISEARPEIYWPDMLANAVAGYGALALAITLSNRWAAIAAALVSILTLYRAAGFIHELTHIRKGALPGFRLGWNLIIGIPLLIPSFLYEEIHTQHHSRTRYGTAQDPEYMPLARMKPWSLPLFIVAGFLAPVALFIRFGLLAPLTLLVPPLRPVVVANFSALSINPGYRRRAPEGAMRVMWRWQEIGASLWAIALITGVATAIIPIHAFEVFVAIFSGVTGLNQIRTLVAHLWDNDGEQMSVTAQYLDSVNVPPPGFTAALWAPVGLRYHALHHLLPSLPYHSLGTAHKRLVAKLGTDSTYNAASYGGLWVLIAHLARATMRPSVQADRQSTANR